MARDGVLPTFKDRDLCKACTQGAGILETIVEFCHGYGSRKTSPKGMPELSTRMA